MDAAGVERGHLVGESIGGTVVLDAALRVPGRVATVTVSNGAHVGGACNRCMIGATSSTRPECLAGRNT
jgi:pimeloyl-ACP methyl ester carboxylesterase